MTHSETKLERRFWRWWLAGLLLFALLIASNVTLMTDLTPSGIGEHQRAGTGLRVDEIQRLWAALGILELAKVGMLGDLIFIGVYSFGAAAGGLLFMRSKQPMLRRLGATVLVAALVFCIADYVETVCQLIQTLQEQGNDSLAGAAAMAQPVKSVAFLVTFCGLLAALLLRRTARRTA